LTRIIKEPTVRRNEILAAAEQLVYTKGYEQMTIQDILDALQISKGAFYHYFDSKQELLEALIEHMLQIVIPLLTPIANDPNLSALEKLSRFFNTAARWKSTRKDYLFQLFSVWYDDDNAIVRQKMFAATIKETAPLLNAIIRQGVDEGVFTTPYPDYAGEVALLLLQAGGDTVARMLLACEPDCNDLEYARNTIAAYTDSLERTLGAPKGSIQIVDDETLKIWFVSTPEKIELNSKQ
jgi:AcrR family transcriptional regulator